MTESSIRRAVLWIVLLTVTPGCVTQALWDWRWSEAPTRFSAVGWSACDDGGARLVLRLEGRPGYEGQVRIVRVPARWESRSITSGPDSPPSLASPLRFALLEHDVDGDVERATRSLGTFRGDRPPDPADRYALRPGPRGLRVRVLGFHRGRGEWVLLGDGVLPLGPVPFRAVAAPLLTPVTLAADMVFFAAYILQSGTGDSF